MINSFRRYGLVVIAFLAVCVLISFALSHQLYASASEDADEEEVEIEQEVGTTGGTTKRYIDISSAWSGAYIYENMTVEGKAEIKESFSMNNLKPGSSSSQSFDAGNSSVGKSGNSGTTTNQDNNTETDENSNAEESNPNSGSNPGPEASNESSSGKEPEPELEAMEIPGWSDLY